MVKFVNDSHTPSAVSDVTSGNTISPYAKVYVRKNKKKGSDMARACGPDTGVGLVTDKRENTCKVGKAI